MKYDEFIQNILDSRGRFNCGDEYHERHHIVPRCMGGSNVEDNLIDLYAREHFIAHKLLAEENPENTKLVFAFSNMAFLKKENRYIITPEEYEAARIALSKAFKSDVHKSMMNKYNYLPISSYCLGEADMRGFGEQTDFKSARAASAQLKIKCKDIIACCEYDNEYVEDPWFGAKYMFYYTCDREHFFDVYGLPH